MKTLKERVIEKLIKSGNNSKDVEDMVKKHFDYASEQYKSVNQIVDCIRTIY